MDSIKAKTNTYLSFGMEYMEQCIPCLYKIQILNPERVAEELMMTGTKRGNLFSFATEYSVLMVQNRPEYSSTCTALKH